MVPEKDMIDDKYLAYEKAVRQVWQDGQVSLDEADMIEALRKSLNITLEEHADIERKIRKEYEKARAEGTTLSMEPSDDTKEDTKDKEAIGDLSSDELSKDLDELSKSIGELGSKILGNNLHISKTEEKVEAVTESDSPSGDALVSGSKLLEQLKSGLNTSTTPELDDELEEPGTAQDTLKSPEPEPQTEPEPDEYVDTDYEVSVEEYLDAGKEAFRAKEFKDAVRLLKKALEIEPENKEVKFFLKKIVTAVKEKKSKTPEPDIKNESSEDTDVWDKYVEEKATPLTVTDEDSVDIQKPGQIPKNRVESKTASKSEIAIADGGGDPSCTSCGGSGVCTWCKGAAKCYWCGGDGKCTKCNGTKEIEGKPCNFCSAEGTCGSCEGTGNCTWCKGTGKCNSCNPAK